MGACDFYVTSSEDSAEIAFRKATENALYEHGHGGYTGTIAEKSSYKMVTFNTMTSYDDAMRLANDLMDAENHWCQDKWGPAACIKFMENNKLNYLFFGYASS